MAGNKTRRARRDEHKTVDDAAAPPSDAAADGPGTVWFAPLPADPTLVMARPVQETPAIPVTLPRAPRASQPRAPTPSKPAPPPAHDASPSDALVIQMACRHPGWGVVRVTNALRNQGVKLTVREVGATLAKYNVWDAAGRAAYGRQVMTTRQPPVRRIQRSVLLAFEIIAFLTIVLAVGLVWL